MWVEKQQNTHHTTHTREEMNKVCSYFCEASGTTLLKSWECTVRGQKSCNNHLKVRKVSRHRRCLQFLLSSVLFFFFSRPTFPYWMGLTFLDTHFLHFLSHRLETDALWSISFLHHGTFLSPYPWDLSFLTKGRWTSDHCNSSGTGTTETVLNREIWWTPYSRLCKHPSCPSTDVPY